MFVRRIVYILIILVCVGIIATIVDNQNKYTKEQDFIINFIDEIFTVVPIEIISLDDPNAIENPDQNGIIQIKRDLDARFKIYLAEEVREKTEIRMTVETYNVMADKCGFKAYRASNFEFDEQDSLYYWVKFDITVTLSSGKREKVPMLANIRLVLGDDNKYKATFIHIDASREFSSLLRAETT